MNLTQFEIKLNKDIDIRIRGEYEGNEKSGKVVIFSHGFGVKRDSWGMFTDLGDCLKNEFLVVRFDYNKLLPGDNATFVYPYSTQAKILDKVISFVKKAFGPSEIDIIAHSMGCLIVGLLPLRSMNKVILLASPVSSPYENMKEYFSQRPETQFDEKGLSKIKRSDGSWTYIDKDFWPDVQRINPPKMYAGLSKKSKVYFVRAMKDEIVTGEDYEPIRTIKSIEYIELEGNHNFDGDARKPLIRKMVSLLEK